MLELEGNKQAAVSEKVDQQDQQERQLCKYLCEILPAGVFYGAQLLVSRTEMPAVRS